MIEKFLIIGASGFVGKNVINYLESLNLESDQINTINGKDDIDLTIALWRTYCGKDHNILKPYIVKESSFKYMSNCLKAHLQRFPYQNNGLGIIEQNILKIIKENDAISRADTQTVINDSRERLNAHLENEISSRVLITM